MKRVAQSCALLCALFQPLAAKPLPAVPSIERHLTAPGSQLTKEQKDDIDRVLERLQQTAKVDLVVYLMPEPNEADLAAFGRKIYQGWGVGREWKGQGTLLVVSSDLHKACIVQNTDSPLLPESLVRSIERSFEGRTSRDDFSTLRSQVARCERWLGSKNPYRLQEALERDVPSSQRYFAGVLVSLVLAAVAEYLLQRTHD